MRLIKHLQDVNSHCQTVHGIGHFSAGNFWSVWKATCRGFLVLFGNGRVRWFQIIEQSLHSRTSTHIHIAPSLFECFPLKLRQHKSLTVRAQWSSTIVLVDTIYIYIVWLIWAYFTWLGLPASKKYTVYSLEKHHIKKPYAIYKKTYKETKHNGIVVCFCTWEAPELGPPDVGQASSHSAYCAS